MELLPYVFIAAVGMGAGVLSGISGGGGGMLMIPAFVLVGLPPQVAVATGKMNGLGAAYGGLMAFKKTGHIRMDIVKPMLPVAIVVALATPFVFAAISSDVFQLLLGVILLLLVPTLFIKKKALQAPNKKRRMVGYVSYGGVLTVQALFGTGVGSLALFVLTLLFGTTRLEANATRRAVMAVMAPISFIAVLAAGYVSLPFGVVGLAATFIGTHIGSRIALQKGGQFVAIATACIITVAGLAMVAGALG